MKINDYVNISDSGIKGFVVLKKSDGTVIFKKNNMIVENGRRFLRELFINSLPITQTSTSATAGGETYTKEFNLFSLKYVGFGNAGTATIFSQKLLASTTPVFVKLTEADFLFEGDSGDNRIVIKAKLDNTNAPSGFLAEELGLFLTKEEIVPIAAGSVNQALFSRVTFDPIPVASGDTYLLEYYIYF
jgi:hypothetical protein